MKIAVTTILLIFSNLFQTYAWYGHLSTMKDKFWLWAVLSSWGVAFIEYMLMVPANRIGSNVMSLPQLKILQEAITLSVFIPFAVFFAKQHIGWNYFFAGICIAGAVFFIFRT
ncbi:MAG: DMT family protein [Planctomycetia bacterium]|nr:DMT family protein [Planctomycetia bacterium]